MGSHDLHKKLSTVKEGSSEHKEITDELKKRGHSRPPTKLDSDEGGTEYKDITKKTGTLAKEALRSIKAKEVEKAKETHKNSGPYKNALEAINSPTFSAVHKAIKESKKAVRESK